MVAAVREAKDGTLGIPISHRRNTMSKSASARSTALGSLPSPPASLPGQRIRLTSSGKLERNESAIDDELNEDMDEEEHTGFKQSRMRRASEGQQLIKDGKKANGSDLKCDKCGKGYKHSSCLSKHLFVPIYLSCVHHLGFTMRLDFSVERIPTRYLLLAFPGRTIVNLWLQMGAHSRVVFDLEAPYF
jgi:hypothetical protein